MRTKRTGILQQMDSDLSSSKLRFKVLSTTTVAETANLVLSQRITRL